jgi:hypothetical protein
MDGDVMMGVVGDVMRGRGGAMFVMPLRPYAPVWGVCVPVSPVSWEPRASGGPRVIPSNDDGLATRLHR